MAEDPLVNFLQSLSQKIQVEKEHKDLMEKINSTDSSAVDTPVSKDPLQAAIEILKEKISEQSRSELIPESDHQTDEPEHINLEKDSFGEFVSSLKNILSGRPVEKPAENSFKHIDVVEKTSDETSSTEGSNKPQEMSSANSAEKSSYIEILDQLSNEPAAKREPEKVNEIRKLIEEYASKYFKKAAVMSEYAGGGGTNAAQFAHGGTMNGDLNVNGNILSGGNNLLNLFSGGGGGGGGDPAVNTAVYSGSANWNNTYTTVNAFSGAWSTDIQNLSFNESNAELSITNGNTISLSSLSSLPVDFGDIPLLSANWSSAYTTTNANSSYWADTRYNVTFSQDVTINGNLTALGSSTFKNTIFTTTSALSVVNTGPGPALYLFQAAGPYDIASFYDGDGVEVLHVGNAQGGGNPLGKVGINESSPLAELTVNGAISSNNSITVLEGNSNQWNSAYTNLLSNSATYLGTTRQYDYVQDGLNSFSYCGYAVAGTATSFAGWTINRLYFSTAGTLISSGAVTGAIWDNRYSYSY